MRKLPFLLMAVALLVLAAGFAAMHAADRNPITAARHAFKHVHGVLGRTSEGEPGERQDAHALLPHDSRARIDRGIQAEVIAPSVDEPSLCIRSRPESRHRQPIDQRDLVVVG